MADMVNSRNHNFFFTDGGGYLADINARPICTKTATSFVFYFHSCLHVLSGQKLLLYLTQTII